MKWLFLSISFGLLVAPSGGRFVEKTLQRVEAEVNRLNRKLEENGRKIELNQALAPTAAFSAEAQFNMEAGDENIPFGQVDLNIGGGYDPFTGRFTPPTAGVYLFLAYAQQAGDSGEIYLKRNGQVMCSFHVTDSAVSPGVCSVILSLSSTDVITVTGSNSDKVTIAAERSGFVGHIISDNITN